MSSARRGGGARDVAAVVLARVDRDRAYAAAALDAELVRSVQLSARDRAFATDLVYGTLRVLPWLRGEIGRLAPRGIDGLDPRVRAHLLLAAYQVFFTRVPAFAAVSEAVDAVRRQQGPRVAAFVNAVLRRLADRAASAGEDLRQEAIVGSVDRWLREGLERALSPEGALAFLRAGGEPPAVALRVEPTEAMGADAERDRWIRRLSDALPEASFERGSLSPRAILARGAGRPQGLPGWDEGAWSVHEEGSQFAALAVGAREGEMVLDACAGRGNKAAVLARAVGSRGAVDVADTSISKLERLGAELARLGLRARSSFGVDWTVGSGDVTGIYDRVLVDAPCSGVGTLRRRPEIALRRDPADLVAFAHTQLAIASRAAERLRPGGVLVFVVCSVLREEAEDVIEDLLRARPELEPSPFDAAEVRGLFGQAASFRLLPHLHGTDGYFVAHLRARREL